MIQQDLASHECQTRRDGTTFGPRDDDPLVTAKRLSRGHKMRRIKILPDKGDPSIVLVVKIEVRDRMNARLDGPDGDSPCPRGLDN